ncbi:ABC transporter substrate-binding protein [Nonomuraea deserti]|nr:ABC transporter substrate-binding protein [Nonomuraea deserti]
MTSRAMTSRVTGGGARPRRLLPLLLAAVLAAASGCGADTGGRLTWKVGVLQCSTDCGFLKMAEEKGFFERRGVEVEFVTLQSASQALPALASGEVDAVEQNAGAFFIASERGDLDASVIGSTMIGLPWAIYARKGITSLAQLQGKSIAISSPTVPAVIANVMLAEAGVSGASMQKLNGGGNADRYRAVVAGTTDSASSPADYVPRVRRDGVNLLALSTDVVPDYPRYSIIARNDRLAAHVNNPIGGLGLNCGVHDALELVRTLDEVASGRSGPDLLDRYERRRRTINIEFVQQQTVDNKQRLEEKDPQVRRAKLDRLAEISADDKAQRLFLRAVPPCWTPSSADERSTDPEGSLLCESPYPT